MTGHVPVAPKSTFFYTNFPKLPRAKCTSFLQPNVPVARNRMYQLLFHDNICEITIYSPYNRGVKYTNKYINKILNHFEILLTK